MDKFKRILEVERRTWKKQFFRVLIILIFVFSSLALVGLFDFERISTGIPAVLKLLPEMFPPDFSRAGTWFKPLIDSLAMSIAGTSISVFLSLFLCFFAARNTTINPIFYNLATLILNVTRAIPELILGIILVAMIGFGALPGTLALGLHSVGMLGKFYAEAIELCDKEPIEAARASGASDLQVIVHSILPQVFPAMADVTFYRWEYNFRASMVVGAVGAGGIGLEIISALRIMDYAQVSALLIVVLVVVTVLDSMSNYLRKSVSE
tara:strand:- start:193 stop:990 length:798 start_codon:yes stop_codon:yes gene_type:complete